MEGSVTAPQINHFDYDAFETGVWDGEMAHPFDGHMVAPEANAAEDRRLASYKLGRRAGRANVARHSEDPPPAMEIDFGSCPACSDLGICEAQSGLCLECFAEYGDKVKFVPVKKENAPGPGRSDRRQPQECKRWLTQRMIPQKA